MKFTGQTSKVGLQAHEAFQDDEFYFKARLHLYVKEWCSLSWLSLM